MNSALKGISTGVMLLMSVGRAWAGSVYTANEISNTVSVIDTVTNQVTATIPLGDENHHRPLYNGIIDAHGANLSPDGKLYAVTGRGSSNVVFINTANNQVVADVVVGREPHVPTFTPDGKEAWVTVRGRNFLSIIDVSSFKVKAQVPTVDGPSMVWFSSDGRRAYVASQKEALLALIDVALHKTLKTVSVAGNFSPFIKLSPDGREVWLTHKTIDKVSAVDAETLQVLKGVDVGPRPNHVEFVRKGGRSLVYVTIGKTNLPAEQRGGENIQVIDQASKAIVKSFATGGREAHGIWATPDGRRLYGGHEVSNDVTVIDTASDQVLATIQVGKRPIDVVLRP
jgi:YVTN family beta-propeller protein